MEHLWSDEFANIILKAEGSNYSEESKRDFLKLMDQGVPEIHELLKIIEETSRLKVKTLNHFAVYLFEGGYYECVIPLLERSLQHDPEDSDALYNLGYTLHSVGLDEQALSFLKKINPSDSSTMSLIRNIEMRIRPLVSVLIPTYNRPVLFELALKSVLEQTYPNIEIIVCDDSTNDETATMIKKYLGKFGNIKYYKNEENLGQFQNDIKCLEHSSGEYINFLMDDDLFHPEKIEKMMSYFIQDHQKEIVLVTSHRQVIDMNGNNVPDWRSTKRIIDKNLVFEGIRFGDLCLENVANYIGEPTTVLFRRSALIEPFGCFGGRKYGCNVDLATWLSMLTQGKIAYIAETLSYFRIHQGQQLQSPITLMQAIVDYAEQITNARSFGYLQSDEKYYTALKNFIHYFSKRREQLLQVQLPEDLKRELDYNWQKVLQEIARHEESRADLYITQECPLVSVVVPAYNRPHYLELGIQSVLSQTYPNIEIIICDDSTNDEVQQMIAPYVERNPNITYIKNERQLYVENFHKVYTFAKGEYINYLMDDDLFHPHKIEKMMNYFLKDNDITLVTSYRELIDDKGNKLPDRGFNRKLSERDVLLDGKSFGNILLKTLDNLIGEPTTVLFKKANVERLGLYQGHTFDVINDLATWIHLLSIGKAVYIAEPLSYFRQHGGQNQKNYDYMYLYISNWFKLIKCARNDGFLSNKQDYQTALYRYMNMATRIINDYNMKGMTTVLIDANIAEYCNKALSELLSE